MRSADINRSGKIGGEVETSKTALSVSGIFRIVSENVLGETNKVSRLYHFDFKTTKGHSPRHGVRGFFCDSLGERL